MAGYVVEELSRELDIGQLEVPEQWAFTRNAEANEKYLQALSLQSSVGKERLLRSEQLFRDVIAMDPDFMIARFGLARTLLALIDVFPERQDEIMAEIDAIVTHAIEQAPNEALGHFMRAGQLWGGYEGDWLGALETLELALEKAPQMGPDIAAFLDRMKRSAGSMSDVIAQKASLLGGAPQSLEASANLQWALYSMRLLDQLEAEYEYSRALDGDRSVVEFWAMLRAIAEDYDEAVIAERIERYKSSLASADDLPEDFDAVVSLDREIALPVLRTHLGRAPDSAAFDPMQIALWADYYNHSELTADAIRALLDLYSRSGWIPWHGGLRNLRNHPAFKEIMRDYGYVDYWRATDNYGDFCRPQGDDDFECSGDPIQRLSESG